MSVVAEVDVQKGPCPLCHVEFVLVPGVDGEGNPVMLVPEHTVAEPPSRPRPPSLAFVEGVDYYGNR